MIRKRRRECLFGEENVFFATKFDIGSSIFGVENFVTHTHFHRGAATVIVAFASADGHDFPDLGFFFSGIGKENATGGFFFAGTNFDENSDRLGV
jgi:hypothetical protein